VHVLLFVNYGILQLFAWVLVQYTVIHASVVYNSRRKYA